MFSRLEYWFNWLTTDPLGFIVYMAYTVVTVLLSLILHECAHAYAALRCGDPTAKMLGRLTLDPRKHLDPLGTICMFVMGFGWAKPVPVNPRTFREYRRDDFIVSVAGSVTNLTIFILCAALSVGVNRLMWTNEYITYYRETGAMQLMLNPYESNIAVYIQYGMELPDYVTRWYAAPWLAYIQRFLLLMAQTNLALAVFNLLPIPPLDGYHLLNDTILKGRFQLDHRTFRIAQLVLIFLCFSDILDGLLHTVNSAVYSAVVNLFLLMTGGA